MVYESRVDSFSLVHSVPPVVTFIDRQGSGRLIDQDSHLESFQKSLPDIRLQSIDFEVGTLSVGLKLGLFSSFLDFLLDRKDNKYLIHISILEKTCLFSYGTITNMGGGKFQSKKAIEERKASGEKLRSMMGSSEQNKQELGAGEALAKVAEEHGIDSVQAIALAYMACQSAACVPVGRWTKGRASEGEYSGDQYQAQPATGCVSGE
jgi:hypothetical protein